MEHFRVPSLARFEDDWHFTHVVGHRGVLYLSGVTGTDENGVVAAEPLRQFLQAFEHLRLYLEAAGASFADVLEMTTYHVALRRHLVAFVDAKDRFIRAPYPAWSAIGVSELITKDALVEIRVIARDPNAEI